MRYFLDTEFNGFGGGLMSLALVPEDKALPEVYEVVEMNEPVSQWVAENVVPNLNKAPRPRAEVAESLGRFLSTSAMRHGSPVVVADWPTDFEHLLALLIAGPGQMVACPDFNMEYRRLAGFNTASTSRVPHNALEDARALRDYCVALEATP